MFRRFLRQPANFAISGLRLQKPSISLTLPTADCPDAIKAVLLHHLAKTQVTNEEAEVLGRVNNGIFHRFITRLSSKKLEQVVCSRHRGALVFGFRE